MHHFPPRMTLDIKEALHALFIPSIQIVKTLHLHCASHITPDGLVDILSYYHSQNVISRQRVICNY